MFLCLELKFKCMDLFILKQMSKYLLRFVTNKFRDDKYQWHSRCEYRYVTVTMPIAKQQRCSNS